VNYSIINIGILAHVDAGKTTLTEQMLFASGALRCVGSVDKGTAVTDNLAVEKERGISVRVATASFIHNGVNVNIIDTPGHVDFCGEVERSLLALDAVVLVLSAVEGVQGHTITLFNALQSLQIPCILFINKIDRQGADVERVMSEISKELTPKTLLLQRTIEEGSNLVQIESIFSDNNPVSCEITERIVETDNTILNHYLEGEKLTFNQLECCLQKAISDCCLIPVLMGVAKSSTGLPELMDGITRYFPRAKGNNNGPLSALVFKIEHDKSLGKMCYIRVFNGTIKPRDVLLSSNKSKSKSISKSMTQKVGQIKSISKGKYVNKGMISVGDIGIVSGLSYTQVGDVFGDVGGDLDHNLQAYSLSTPMLTVQVKPENSSQIMDLFKALTQLSDEDPLLDLQWLPEIRELHIKISGLIQIEILQAVLKERFDLTTAFTDPSIIYKETPAKTAYGYERYWMPKPCWAILKLKIEPGENASGVSFSSEVSTNDVAAKYQKEIEATIDDALKQGIKGWQVTDCKITLTEGEDHNVHSRSGDFIIATPMAMMNGLLESGTTLLEPIVSFSITAPLDLLGTITSDITKMRGVFESPQIENFHFKITGKFPASTTINYPVRLASLSGGKAKLTTKLVAYEACTDEQGRVTQYRGVNPLDRDRWILQARGALK
jgi:ribosomal protection tetracycline resistance protein